MNLARAHLSRRRVRLRYVESDAARVERTADVLALAFEMSRWLVAAWCPDGGSLRIIDLARVNQVKRLRQCAGPAPQGFESAGFRAPPLPRPRRRCCQAHPAVTRPPDSGAGRRAHPVLADRAPARWRLGVPRPHLATRRPPGARGLPRLRWCATLGGAHASSPPRREGEDRGGAPARPGRLDPRAVRSGHAPAHLRGLSRRLPRRCRGEGRRSSRATRMRSAASASTSRPSSIGKDEGQVGYSIDAHSCTLPTIEFTPEEAALLWTAGTAALRLSQHPLRDELESALRKLMRGRARPPAPRRNARELVADAHRVSRSTSRSSSTPGSGGERVRIRYWRVSSGKEIERRGRRLRLGEPSRGVDLRGLLPPPPGGPGLLRLPRTRREGGEGRQGRGYQIPADLRHPPLVAAAVWDYEVHRPIPPRCVSSGALARIARQLLPGAKVETDESGARIARLEVRNLRGLVRQALAWGPDAELLEPEDGREMALEILARSRRGAPRERRIRPGQDPPPAAPPLRRGEDVARDEGPAARARGPRSPGRKDEKEVLADVAALQRIWIDPRRASSPSTSRWRTAQST